ncbi:MAG TPA: hypothetical protein VH062_10455 [Polyangiaceae bacterium]|jgi:hypothetical protein|nr:hypothetical protein [Polyangiaceae bacterium]
MRPGARDAKAVAEKCVEVGILDAARVHLDAVDELTRVLLGDPSLEDEVLEGPEHDVALRASRVDRVELAPELRGACGLHGWLGEIHRVVSATAEGVHDRRLVAHADRQETRRERERLAVRHEKGATHRDGERARGRARRRRRAGQRLRHAALSIPRSRSTSPAVAFAELTTPGIPAPG